MSEKRGRYDEHDHHDHDRASKNSGFIRNFDFERVDEDSLYTSLETVPTSDKLHGCS